MPVPFKIISDFSRIPEKKTINSIPLDTAEALPLKTHDIICLIDVDFEAEWLIERNGKLEEKHIDFFFMQTGKLIVESEFGKQTVMPGQMMIIPSRFDRRLRIPEYSRHIYLRSDSPHLYPHINRITIQESLFGEELSYYVNRLLPGKAHPNSSFAYRSHLFGLIEIFFSQEVFLQNREHVKILDKFIHILNSDISQNYSVSALARRFGVSLSAFEKLCRKHQSKSPSQIITDVKMQHAVNMLHYTDYSIEEISRRLGYANMFAFSKAFKKNMEMSPLNYRKSQPLKYGNLFRESTK
jgi:AraC-like DNA-binding protein